MANLGASLSAFSYPSPSENCIIIIITYYYCHYLLLLIKLLSPMCSAHRQHSFFSNVNQNKCAIVD